MGMFSHSSRSIALLFVPSRESGHFIFVTLIELSRTAQTPLAPWACDSEVGRGCKRGLSESKNASSDCRGLLTYRKQRRCGEITNWGAKNAELTSSTWVEMARHIRNIYRRKGPSILAPSFGGDLIHFLFARSLRGDARTRSFPF